MKLLPKKLVISDILSNIYASFDISINCTSSSKIFSIFSNSSAFESIKFCLFKNLYSSFLYFLYALRQKCTYFSNSNMISCFFSSSFLISSSKPSVILFNCCSSSLASSSFTYSTIFALSSTRRFVLSIIFRRSITFYFTEFAI